jgi:DedD protein
MPSPELYKDKVEVSLDGRQIFYLFFGGAVIVGMVFVLGVMVGRRVEARGHLDHAHTQAAADPLAALDRLEGSGGLSFHGALTGAAAPSDVDKAIADIEKARAAEPKPEAKIDPPKPEIKPEVKPEIKPVAKPEAKIDPPKPELKAEPAVAKPDKDKHDKVAKVDPEKSNDKADGKPDAKPEKKPKKPAHGDPLDDSSKFTLQLSSFQDKGEADTFLASVKASGYGAYVTAADVDGKTFYRIRLGTYRSIDAANDAKSDFEKATKKAAYVTRL